MWTQRATWNFLASTWTPYFPSRTPGCPHTALQCSDSDTERTHAPKNTAQGSNVQHMSVVSGGHAHRTRSWRASEPTHGIHASQFESPRTHAVVLCPEGLGSGPHWEVQYTYTGELPHLNCLLWGLGSSEFCDVYIPIIPCCVHSKNLMLCAKV